MNDDLARFPTPKEAFGVKRPPHTSAAFSLPLNVPPPPQQQRFRGQVDPHSQLVSGSLDSRSSEDARTVGVSPGANGARSYSSTSQSSANSQRGHYGPEMNGRTPPAQHQQNQPQNQQQLQQYQYQQQQRQQHLQNQRQQQLQYQQQQQFQQRQQQQHQQQQQYQPRPQYAPHQGQQPLQQPLQQIPHQDPRQIRQSSQQIQKVGRRPVPQNQPLPPAMPRQMQHQPVPNYPSNHSSRSNSEHNGVPGNGSERVVGSTHGPNPAGISTPPHTHSPALRASNNSPGQYIPVQPRSPDPLSSVQPALQQVSSQHSLPSQSSRSNTPAQPSQASPPGRPTQSSDLRSIFDEVDQHKRGYLTERELSKALVNGDYTLFDGHTVRLMMKMFDHDGDGAIYFAEFAQLWKYLHDWRQVFDQFDTSKNEAVSLDEFIRALAAFGYNLSTNCLLFMFNAGSKLNRQGQREMSFDMFVQSCISIKSITDTFKKYDTDRDGYVTMSFEDFLIETTKLH